MTILCTLAVAILSNNIVWIVNTPVKGTIIEETNQKYLGDFSIEAEQKGYVSKLNRVWVNKSNCEEVK